MASVLVTPLGGCAKSRAQKFREEDRARTNSPAAGGVDLRHRCRYQSATASSRLNIGTIASFTTSSRHISEVLRCSGAALEECSEADAKTRLPEEGSFQLKLKLDRLGFVKQTWAAKGKGISTKTQECVRGLVKKMHFPPHRKERLPISVDLSFEPTLTTSPRFSNVVADPKVTSPDASVNVSNAVMRQAHRRMTACFVLGLERQEKMAGTLSYEVEVLKSGVANQIQLSQQGSLTKEVVGCARVVLRAQQYPQPSGTKGTIRGRIRFAKRQPDAKGSPKP